MNDSKILIPDRKEFLARANAQEFIDSLPKPLNRLANDLLDANIKEWVNDGSKNGTFGQEAIIHTGFTQNQNEYLLKIKKLLEESTK